LPRLLDYGARSYDPLTCSWTTPDPLAHKYLSWSPYSFTAANPVNFVDPDGRDAIIIYDEVNKLITIVCNIYIYGNEASDSLAKQYQASLQSSWGQMDSIVFNNETYSVDWNINVSKLDGVFSMDFSIGVNNYFLVSSQVQTSVVRNKHEGIIRPIVNGNNDMPHEFGHPIGLKDRYNNNSFKAEFGYEGNIMAVECGMGVTEPQNIIEALLPFFNADNPPLYKLNKYNGQIK